MRHHEIIEISVSTFTLCLSFWLAFGPLRHRLPRFITRFAKYSAALKLVVLSTLCWWALHMNVRAHGSHPIRWMLGVLGFSLLGGAVFVITRKTVIQPAQSDKPAMSGVPMALDPVNGGAA